MAKPTERRIVLDTNLLISFLIAPKGVAGRMVEAGMVHRLYRVVSCPAILNELRRVAALPKIRNRYGIGDEDIEALIELLAARGIIAEGQQTVSVVQDPGDNMVLACAREASASLIITGDSHLLDLKSWEGICIVTPREASRILEIPIELPEFSA